MPGGQGGFSNLSTLSSTSWFASIGNAAIDLHGKLYSRGGTLLRIDGKPCNILGRILYKVHVRWERKSAEIHGTADIALLLFRSFPAFQITDPRRQTAKSLSPFPMQMSPGSLVHVQGTSKFGTSLVKMCDRLGRRSWCPLASNPRASSKGIHMGMEPGSCLLWKGKESGSKFPFQASQTEVAGVRSFHPSHRDLFHISIALIEIIPGPNGSPLRRSRRFRVLALHLHFA